MREQLFQPSFPHSASYPEFSVTVVRMPFFAALQPIRAMSHISSFAHVPQINTSNFHTGAQMDSTLQGFLWPQYNLTVCR